MAQELLRRGDLVCPVCGNLFIWHDSYPRHFIDGNGLRHDGWLAQLKCPICNKHHTLIPDFIMPYKHYSAEVIESAINDTENGDFGRSSCPADDSTVRRWINQFHDRAPAAIGYIQSILFDNYLITISSLEQQEKGLFFQLSRLIREFKLSESIGVIGRANFILTRYNSGLL